MSEPVRRQIKLADGAMSCLEWAGEAKPVLHFAHANGFNAETYKALLTPLAEHFHVIASDARGHGLTTLATPPGMAKKWAVYRHDLEAFLDRIHPGPVVLAGHSMGSIASLMVAAAKPERVRALILVEPVLVPAMAMAARKIVQAASSITQIAPPPDLAERAAKRRDVFPSLEDVFNGYRGRGAFKTWPDEVLRDYLRGGMVPTGNGSEMRLSCTPAWESESFRSTPTGASKLAAKVRCPMTVLYADDGTARASEIATIARLKPGARLVHVPKATHFLPMEFPEIVREEILRCAAAHGAS